MFQTLNFKLFLSLSPWTRLPGEARSEIKEVPDDQDVPDVTRRIGMGHDDAPDRR